MSLLLTSSVTALAPNRIASFLAVGGTAPYVYSVVPGGAGGSIDSATGLYTAPAEVSPNPKQANDIILVTDDAAQTAQLPILVTNVLGLVAEIIQSEMGLAAGRVYFWDQKIEQPHDNGLYVAIGIQNSKPFGNTTRCVPGAGLDAVQSINVLDTLSIDIISRGPDARTRKEEVLLALNSIYSESQQELNSFFVGKISTNFVNLSQIDGAAIPYRFNISVNVQYFVTKVKAVPYFDTFSGPEVTTQS